MLLGTLARLRAWYVLGLLLWTAGLMQPAGAGEHVLLADAGCTRWHVSLAAAAGETERLAAAEIAAYVDRISGAKLPVVTEDAPIAPAVAIQAAGRVGEGFSLVARADGIQVRGEGPVGCLYGAYALLERLGCRWYYPGALGEVVPSRRRLELAPFSAAEKPSFPSRSIILAHPAYQLPEWIDWCARQRLNNLFCCGVWATPEHRERMRVRGIALEIGGHEMPGLLPRALFAEHPDYFREAGGKRTSDYNFCPSSPGARDLVRGNARAYFRARPGAPFYHLWPDDLMEGGWCSCDACKGLSTSDQALEAANLVAEALEEADPSARLAYLAYHDTTAPPARTRPRANVFLLNAPRERCYAHSIDDRRCRRNLEEYLPAWEQLLRLFEQDGRGNSHVFEYYADTILFRTMQPPLLCVVPADARYYRRLRTPVYQSLVVSTRDWHSPPLALYLFARAAWNADVQGEGVLRDFARRYFGPEASAVERYFRETDQAFQSILDFDAYRGPIPDLRAPLTTPEAVGRRKLREVERGRRLLANAGQALMDARLRCRQEPYAGRLRREWEVCEITRDELATLRAQMASALPQPPGPGREQPWQEAARAAAEGLRAIERAQRWMARFPENRPYLDGFRIDHEAQSRSLEGAARQAQFRRLRVFGGDWLASPETRMVGQEVRTRPMGNWQPEGLFTLGPVRIPVGGLEVTYTFVAERIGRDSQAMWSTDGATLAYRFCLFPTGEQFVLYTRRDGQWAPRANGGKAESGRPYNVRVVLKPASIAATVTDESGAAVWASGEAAMDRVERTGLGFVDAEPEADGAATRWRDARIRPLRRSPSVVAPREPRRTVGGVAEDAVRER